MAIKFDIPGKKVAFSAANNAAGFSAAASAGASADHTRLRNRDAADQHPMSAITGLQAAIDSKADAGDIPSLDGYATQSYVNGAVSGLQSAIDEKADMDDIPSLAGYATEAYVNSHHDSSKQDKISDLSTIRTGAAKGATAIQTESDPTVPSWAKASQKPTYTAAEVGAAESVHRHTLDDIGSFQPLELTLKPNTYVETNGPETHYSGWTSTDFIPVEPGKRYQLYWNLTSSYCCWYKSDKSFLSQVTFNNGMTDVFPPANAAFLRVSNRDAAMATLTVSTAQGLELVKSVNGISPDSNGNVAVPIPSLDGYATEAYVNGHHDSTKQDTLTPGDNITIDGGVISAAGMKVSTFISGALKPNTRYVLTDYFSSGISPVFRFPRTADLGDVIEISWENTCEQISYVGAVSDHPQFDESYDYCQLRAVFDADIWWISKNAPDYPDGNGVSY